MCCSCTASTLVACYALETGSRIGLKAPKLFGLLQSTSCLSAPMNGFDPAIADIKDRDGYSIRDAIGPQLVLEVFYSFLELVPCLRLLSGADNQGVLEKNSDRIWAHLNKDTEIEGSGRKALNLEVVGARLLLLSARVEEILAKQEQQLQEAQEAKDL